MLELKTVLENKIFLSSVVTLSLFEHWRRSKKSSEMASMPAVYIVSAVRTPIGGFQQYVFNVCTARVRTTLLTPPDLYRV